MLRLLIRQLLYHSYETRSKPISTLYRVQVVLAGIITGLVVSLAACSLSEEAPTATVNRQTPSVATVQATVTPATEATAESTPEPSPTSEPDDEPQLSRIIPSDYALYAQEKYGFAFGYPEEWYLQNEGPVTQLTSFEPDMQGGTEGIPEGSTKIDVLIHEDPPDMDAFREMLLEGGRVSNLEITQEERREVTPDVEGTLFKTEGRSGLSATFYTIINGVGVQLSALGDLAPFEDIIGTIHLTNPDETDDMPEAVRQGAMEAAAAFLEVDVAELDLIRADQVEWPDACLGAPEGGELCAQVITPGWRILIGYLDERVEIHTDRTGESARVR